MSKFEGWLQHAYDEEGKKYADNRVGACDCFKTGAIQAVKKLMEVMRRMQIQTLRARNISGAEYAARERFLSDIRQWAGDK